MTHGSYCGFYFTWMKDMTKIRALKYTMIKRMFGEGCFSPVMYFEAANILINQPELLRILNSFEIQVLNFAAKYKIVTKDLAKQTAELMIKDKAYNEGYF